MQAPTSSKTDADRIRSSGYFARWPIFICKTFTRGNVVIRRTPQPTFFESRDTARPTTTSYVIIDLVTLTFPSNVNIHTVLFSKPATLLDLKLRRKTASVKSILGVVGLLIISTEESTWERYNSVTHVESARSASRSTKPQRDMWLCLLSPVGRVVVDADPFNSLGTASFIGWSHRGICPLPPVRRIDMDAKPYIFLARGYWVLGGKRGKRIAIRQ